MNAPQSQRPHIINVVISVVTIFISISALLFSWHQSRDAKRAAQEQSRDAKRAAQEQTEDVKNARRSADESAHAASQLVAMAERQAASAEQSVQIANKTLKLQNRPWLLYEDLKYEESLLLTVQLKNFGKTPAFRVNFRNYAEYGHLKKGPEKAERSANGLAEGAFTWMNYSREFVREGIERPLMDFNRFSPQTVLPEHETGFVINVPTLVPSKYDIRLLGFVTYFDVDGVSYQTHLCFDLLLVANTTRVPFSCMDRE